MYKMDEAQKNTNTSGTSKDAVVGQPPSRKPPKNARIVKSSARTGTISRAAARAAVKALMTER
ncbi:MAG TPA: hypothetical protein VF006_01995 [Longimicrobium sp.]